MSRDGLLPPWCAKIHPKYKTPVVATALTGVAVAVCAAFFPIDEIVDLTNIGTLFAFILVCAGVMILRVTDPDRQRPFRAPWVWLTAPSGIISCFLLMVYLPKVTWVRFFVWLFIGLAFYLAMVVWRENLHRGGMSERKSFWLTGIAASIITAIVTGGSVWLGLWK